ncbi:MAG: YfhO family protein [Bacteroidota bacterium]|nr:YfhO family protein [Bacteroidota bacterium]
MKQLQDLLKPLLPHILIGVLFIVISFVYFSPLMEGKELTQMDNIHAQGMSQELINFEKTHPGQDSRWTNSMFGGMPAYQIKGGPNHNVYLFFQRVLRLNLPYTTVAIVFTLLLGFYILLLTLNVDKWISFAGALAFAFASYNFIIIGAGHITKAYAIAYMAPVIAGILLTYKKKYLAGGIFTAIALGIEISCDHPQILFYLFLTILLLVVVYFIYAIKEKELKNFFIASAILACSATLAVLPNTSMLWTTWEYGKESIRGKTELTQKKAVDQQANQQQSSGLDKDYALAWSYGKAETFTLLIPNFQGGGSEGFDEKSETYKTLQQAGVQSPENISRQLPAYWGEMPFTSGPVYFGAIVCFLFVLGLFLVKGPAKWWLLVVSILSIVLSWGKNAPMVTDFFFYHFPLYNKFRTVSMILVIANFAVPLLGFLALRDIFTNKIEKKKVIKALKYSLGIVGGITLIFALMSSLFFNFTSSQDTALSQQLKSSGWPDNLISQLLNAMQADRASMLRSDAWRSLIFILLGGGLIWAYVSKKIKSAWFTGALALLMLVDLWPIDKRYLNNDNFVTKRVAKNTFERSTADEFILKDTDPDYRVLNITRNPFTDGYTPYFHKSIGGYHGAKLRRYQDLIDGPLTRDIMALQQTLTGKVSQDTLAMVLHQLPILNMLNTKFIIYNPDAMPIINFNALGNAWFVKQYKLVNNADEEYAGLNNFDPSSQAIIDKRFKEVVSAIPESSADTTKGTIKLLSYLPNDLVYESKSTKPQLAVFSEIYYAEGWNAFLDGKPVQHCRADYVLRAMPVPAGKHNIEFKFQPKSYDYGQKIALASSSLVVLLLLGLIGKMVYDKRKES